jgi:hypothetical protein
VSVCNACHEADVDENYNAILCGLDGTVAAQ